MSKVLIVEDDPHVSGLYRDKLKLAGYESDIAQDGHEGFQKAIAGGYDLILLDVFMPNTDGITMLKRLRTDRRGKDVPVIMLSNALEPEGLADIEGMYSDYILKVDLGMDELVERVAKYIHH